MYDSASCSYAGALELKGASGAGAAAAAAAGVTAAGVKQENWPYRGLTCGSTFQRLKESVDKAKQALADRSGYLAGAFSPPPRANPSAISPTASITGDGETEGERTTEEEEKQEVEEETEENEVDEETEERIGEVMFEYGGGRVARCDGVASLPAEQSARRRLLSTAAAISCSPFPKFIGDSPETFVSSGGCV
ncbi:hypothetical protein ALC57_14438 [Trachymyrmex cornetzi]|uniref:Uncharacterized protein n=1 Tax=Trachymyrmex cornetzi TaxID=471704 RepID=A0A195DKL9_9HYME|nr:hypothetical protein ALC57_14438 [Trachymyrmex cornetzi]